MLRKTKTLLSGELRTLTVKELRNNGTWITKCEMTNKTEENAVQSMCNQGENPCGVHCNQCG